MRLSNLALLVSLSLLAPLALARAQEQDEAWVRKRVKEIKESDTTEWRKIGWSDSLLEAEKRAKEESRPLFLFTLDGNLDTGRC